MSKIPIAVAIMAGGSSSRMGRDKALLDAGHGPHLERLVRLVQSIADLPIMVVGREQPTDWSLPGVTFIKDDTPDQGPLGGVVTALGCAEIIICLACDLFALEKDALIWLHEQAQACEPLSPGLVIRHSAGIEPLFAVYTAGAYDEARRRLHIGERALHRFITSSGISQIEAPAWLVPQLVNINTPAELERYQRQQDNGAE